jgi:hypothetical protein
MTVLGEPGKGTSPEASPAPREETSNEAPSKLNALDLSRLAPANPRAAPSNPATAKLITAAWVPEVATTLAMTAAAKAGTLSHPPPNRPPPQEIGATPFRPPDRANCYQPPAAPRRVSDDDCHNVEPAGALIRVTRRQSRWP